MALIKCPECGRNISDKAKSCPGCGCPVDKSFNIEKHDDESFYATGYIGRKGLKCPNTQCRGNNIEVINDIPTWKKSADIASFGTVTEMTKKEYRKEMIYRCRDCGTIWDENGIRNEIPKTIKKNNWKLLLVVSALLSLFVYGGTMLAVICSEGKIAGNVFQFGYAFFGLISIVFTISGIRDAELIKIAIIFIILSIVFSAILIIKSNITYYSLLVPLVLIALNDIYYNKNNDNV